MNLVDALEERLHVINCTPDDIRRFVEKYPAEMRMTKVRIVIMLCCQAVLCNAEGSLALWDK